MNTGETEFRADDFVRRRRTLLRHIVELTRAGRLVWDQEEDELEAWTAHLGNHRISIRFRYPMLGEGVVSGADILEVSVGGVVFTFFSSSEENDLVLETLAAAFPDWAEHLRAIDARLRDAEALLAEQEPKSG
jgi:hypothetical protein